MIGVRFNRLKGFKAAYHHYVRDYMQYLEGRGFGSHVNDWFFVKRGFLECWLQPGFHRFWQVWNPGIGYFAYKVFLWLGGKTRPATATMGAFLVSGLVHNLVANLILWRWDFPLPFTFTLFGLLTIVFRWLDRHTNLNRWPRIYHLAINIGLIILSFDFGFFMDDLLSCFLLSG